MDKEFLLDNLELKQCLQILHNGTSRELVRNSKNLQYFENIFTYIETS